MKNLSKILAMLLVLTMCMSLFCISAFADEISELEPDEKNEEVQEVKEKPVLEAAPVEEEQPAAEKEEPAAEPAAEELEEDEEEKEAPWVGPFALTGDENASGSENTFRNPGSVTLPSEYTIGSGPMYGSCEDLKGASGFRLFYGIGTATNMASQLDWYNCGGGVFYIGENFLKKLTLGQTYVFQFKNLSTGVESDPSDGTKIVGPALALWPLDTPKHVLGSASSLSFVMTDDIGSPTDINDGIGWVMVGDVVLVEGRDYYLTVTYDGSSASQAIITLSPYFLNKLTSGASYTLKVTDGSDVATSSFSIVGYGTSTSSPRTGDESNIGLWVVLLLLSGTAAVVIVPKIKKHG